MDKIRILTYRQVWRQEHLIYQIERFRLPFPVSLRQAGIFSAGILVMAFLGVLPAISHIPAVIRYFLVPGLFAWFMTKQRLDGKLPHRWLLSWLRYLVAPKRLNRFRPIEKQGDMKLTGWDYYRQKG